MSNTQFIALIAVAISLGVVLSWYMRRRALAAPAPVQPEAPEQPVKPACDFVHATDVFFDDSVETRDDAIALLSHAAVTAGVAQDADSLAAAFLEREAEGTTGMTDGFAIPHAKSATISRAAVLVLKSARGITGWDTMDGNPVTVAIALLIPGEQVGTDHLRLLSRVAESLMDEGFRSDVKSADTAESVAAAINSRLG